MSDKQTAVISARVPVDLIGGVERSAAKRQCHRSEMVEKALSLFLAKDIELTGTERAFYQKRVIIQALDNHSGLLGAHFEGDLRMKLEHSIAFCAGILNLFPLRESSNLAFMGLYEILTEVKYFDISLFEEIKPTIKKFKKLNNRMSQMKLFEEKANR